MIYGLYISAAGALAENAKQQVLANNMANVNSPGFKRDFSVFQIRPNEIEEDFLTPDERNPVHEQVGGGLFVHQVYTDFSSGAMEETFNPFDVAIEGDRGFFVVEGNKPGELLYTRAGNFSKDSEGYLVTQNGRKVMGQNGPIQIGETGEIHINEEGRIFDTETNAELGQLRIVDFQNLQDLEKVGETLFQSMENPQELNAFRLRSGALETSGVNPVAEMVNLISAFRSYETNMIFIRNQDQNLGRVVNDVGRL